MHAESVNVQSKLMDQREGGGRADLKQNTYLELCVVVTVCPHVQSQHIENAVLLVYFAKVRKNSRCVNEQSMQ